MGGVSDGQSTDELLLPLSITYMYAFTIDRPVLGLAYVHNGLPTPRSFVYHDHEQTRLSWPARKRNANHWVAYLLARSLALDVAWTRLNAWGYLLNLTQRTTLDNTTTGDHSWRSGTLSFAAHHCSLQHVAARLDSIVQPLVLGILWEYDCCQWQKLY